jgi:tRNA/rRNA methyltransferase
MSAAGEEAGRPGPAIILVEPQLGQNIGTAARAMANFGLTELRLVNPRDGWPNEEAIKAASGAAWVIEGARLFSSVEEAIADLGLVYATSARLREMAKPVVGPAQAAPELRRRIEAGERAGILFGRERTGLDNDEVALADAVLTYPVDPRFASLNLAQAVLLMGYEWFKVSGAEITTRGPAPEEMPLAPKAEVMGLFEHLEQELDAAGFFRPPEKRHRMIHNLRSLFLRASLTSQDIRTLRGIIVALTGRVFRRADKGGEAA